MSMPPKELVAAYVDLLDKALKIVQGAPFWAFIDEVEYCFLSIDGETASLCWPRIDMGYHEHDSPSLEGKTKAFPAFLLSLSDDEINEWKRLNGG
jgi:hypothetical protein